MKRLLQTIPLLLLPSLSNAQDAPQIEIHGHSQSGIYNAVIYPCDSMAVVTVNKQDGCPVDVYAIRGDIRRGSDFVRVQSGGSAVVIYTDGRMCFVWEGNEILNEVHCK